MERPLTLCYRCKECPHNFGDPELTPTFNAWEMAVILHMFDVHGMKPRLLNDMLLPTWERCAA